MNQPEPADPPAPDPAAAERVQQEADALRETAQSLPEIDPDDAKYW